MAVINKYTGHCNIYSSFGLLLCINTLVYTSVRLYNTGRSHFQNGRNVTLFTVQKNLCHVASPTWNKSLNSLLQLLIIASVLSVITSICSGPGVLRIIKSPVGGLLSPLLVQHLLVRWSMDRLVTGRPWSWASSFFLPIILKHITQSSTYLHLLKTVIHHSQKSHVSHSKSHKFYFLSNLNV